MNLEQVMRKQLASRLCPGMIGELSQVLGINPEGLALSDEKKTKEYDAVVGALRCREPRQFQFSQGEFGLVIARISELTAKNERLCVGLSWSEYCGYFMIDKAQLEIFLEHYLRPNQEEPVLLIPNEGMIVVALYDDIENGDNDNRYFQIRLYRP